MKKGFSLIEMIVALGVFSGAALIGVSALLSLTVSQRKAMAIQSAYDNMRFGVEVISKDLRTGDIYHCSSAGNLTLPQDCPPGVNDADPLHQSITFLNSSGQTVRYRFSTCGASGCIQKTVNGGTDEQITGDDVNIQDLRFFVTGSRPSVAEIADGDLPFQAVITIMASGEAGSGKSKSQFSLETTVTQRTVRK
ncbi:MAG: hypothetical protein UW30_C0017G0010 [Candidatus Giovannonibacteria bacterium GW2011_GWA2_44_13b]|uniref:Uncharacterized protein n=2 Tax=Candidatus Giovannoniibacteriota TaxID=1752738 RepID=A0A0G1H1R4_9BACT|nr:MAG: hypothetical protein UW30_C0017G0010 [Candidatus Giovannonibacteria bacterium GW2011_GWA2_44_13b]OGF82026.1 MAG: hypothetical protein A2924_00280 [Candidatus Giovannonibacteria bacterium RIFCSPLOWO2_01_FULL_44_16]